MAALPAPRTLKTRVLLAVHLRYTIHYITAVSVLLPVNRDAQDTPQTGEDVVDSFRVSAGSELCGDDGLFDV